MTGWADAARQIVARNVCETLRALDGGFGIDTQHVGPLLFEGAMPAPPARGRQLRAALPGRSPPARVP